MIKIFIPDRAAEMSIMLHDRPEWLHFLASEVIEALLSKYIYSDL